MQNSEIRKKIYSMIIPITMESVLQLTASFISMAMIGRIDTLAVGAVGISNRITQIVWALFKGIATGASVFVAQAYGAGNYEKLRKVVQQTLLSSVVFVIIFQQIIFWKADMLLSIFNPTKDLMEAGLIYMRIVSIGLPFMVIMLVVAGVLQGTGNAKTPMKITLIMNFSNIVVGIALIFGKLGIKPMGFKGAAVAMVIAQFISASIGLYILFNKNGLIGILNKKSILKADYKQIFDIYAVGIPSSMESLFWQFAAIILTRIILTYGNTAFAAYQLALQAEAISYMPATGFGVAATTFVGQCLGANKEELGRVYMKELVKGAAVLTVVSASILVFLPKNIMMLMTYDNEVVKIGAMYLMLMGLVQLPQNISGVLNGALRGAGYTKVPMIVAMTGLWGIRIPFSWVFTQFFNYGIIVIWIVMCVDLIFRFVLSIMLYKKKDIYSADLLFKSE